MAYTHVFQQTYLLGAFQSSELMQDIQNAQTSLFPSLTFLCPLLPQQVFVSK